MQSEQACALREIMRKSRAISDITMSWVASLPANAMREQLLTQSLDDLVGPSFFDGTCLDPLVTAHDVGYFESWREDMTLCDGDIVSFRWGSLWRDLAEKAYGTDLSLKMIKFIAGEPWLVCNEFPVPLAGQEVLGVLRALRPLATPDLPSQRAHGRVSGDVVSLGTAIMLAAADMAMSGGVSGGGPSESAERQLLERTGWQRYSVKVGDRWYAYNRLDPLGMLLGMSADMVDILAHGDEMNGLVDFGEYVAAIVASIGGNVMSKSYLSGLSEFFEVLSNPKRYSDEYVERLVGSLVPTGVAEAARQVDPYMREVQSWVDALRARTPGLSDSLPIRRDLWGRAMSYQSGLGRAYDLVSPVYSRQENPEPIDSELIRLETSIPMPQGKASFDGVTVDLSQYQGAYSRYVELAGNELKHPAWNKGAKDYLNAVVSGKHEMSEAYRIRTDGPDGGKDVFIRDAVNDYRERARNKLLEEFPDLRREVESKQSRGTGSVQRQ